MKPETGYSRWLNRTPRGIPGGTKLGSVEVRYWPPGMTMTLPNSARADAKALGLTYVGPCR